MSGRLALGLTLLLASAAAAQPAGRGPRVAVVIQGGAYHAVVEGLRAGLREAGLEDGRHFVLDVHDARGDLAAIEETARRLGRERPALLYTVASSVTAAVKRATADLPIVFCVGSDPVTQGFVESFAKPGGRLTGVHYLSTDLTAKRLELLKALVPKARRVVTFYDPGNAIARESARAGQEAARQLGITLIERRVASVDELRAGLRGLKPGEADALFVVSDARVVAQGQLVADEARSMRLPAMFQDPSLVARGGFAAYGIDYRGVGRLSAKYVQRVLAGARPADLPVENYNRLELAVNLATARALGLSIPPDVLLRADRVIE